MDNGQMDMLDLLEGHGEWLLSNIPEGGKNDCGVFVDNVLKFREGKLTRDNIEIKLCRFGKYIYYEFDYMVGTYGSGSPINEQSFNCHRNNTIKTLVDAIYNDFIHSVCGYDRNLDNYKEGKKKLVALCRKACDRIAKEVK